MSVARDKTEARTAARIRRAAAYEAYKGLGGGIFVQPFIRALQPEPGDVIAAYAAIGTEADPERLVDILSDHGCLVALPCVTGVDLPLSFRLWAKGSQLVPGPLGTREPAEGAEMVPDFLIVPLLAFDGRGHRLGYGGGYYDRTLAALRRQKPGIVAVGLAFAAQEVTNLPIEPEDEPLDWIVTEREARAFSGQTT
jgi:5-formyltetrahydrofolate cyclo-ligase